MSGRKSHTYRLIRLLLYLFCKQCYARKFGIRGVGFGVGAGALAMDTGDRFGNTESLPYVEILFIEFFVKFLFY